MCVYIYSKTLMQHVYLYYLLYFMVFQLRLVYCKARRAPTTETIGKVGFQSKQWIGCRPNHNVAYTENAWALQYTSFAPYNKRILTVFKKKEYSFKVMMKFISK